MNTQPRTANTQPRTANTQQSTAAKTPTRSSIPTSALGVSAVLLLVMVISQAAGKWGMFGAASGNATDHSILGSAAYAYNNAMIDVAVMDDFTLLTAEVSGGGDILCVVDSRTETIFVYEVQARQRFELVRRENLAQLFDSARRRGPGG